ncbi:helix-turn-helix domain-containing protein [Luteibacter yeojuensis]|uniref:HTH araC/xylS-type domain-containing protein n=1 Tax=Luteibacter yeojuensis TaxID=345309 RepID=A0A0F3KY27_9GAMM|nr:helix-turn-helix domain-containing protein [Luteibacter yeojuensis]KJV36113.1 hypothetical protein VI08_06465 [Luteibacter yeojuensis]
MTHQARTPVFARESLEAKDVEPANATLVASSRQLGWSSLLLDHFEATGASDDYERRLTPDIRLVVALAGAWDITAHYGRRTSRAILHAGSVAVNDGGQAMRLRWRNRHPEQPFRLAAIYLPRLFLEEAADALRRPGQHLHTDVGSSLVLNDMAIGGTLAALVKANKQGAGELYAEQGARWLAMHLVHAHGRAFDPAEDDRRVGGITDRRLARVIEFMQANLEQHITLADMARVASVSPFHFARLFHRAVGMSPQRYLTEERMRMASAMLRTTSMPVADVAAACGYARHAAFSAAFLKRYAMPPLAYRRLTPGSSSG